MSRALLAEFRSAEALLAAAKRARDAGWRSLDAHTPFAVPGMEEALGLPPTRLRLAMFAGFVLGAGAAFGTQWYSAVYDYPILSGGRPLFSWQTFVVSTFEFGVLSAALAGFVALLWTTGMPRPHRPIFAVEGFERASQDRFFLRVDDAGAELATLDRVCDGLGAVRCQEIEG